MYVVLGEVQGCQPQVTHHPFSSSSISDRSDSVTTGKKSLCGVFETDCCCCYCSGLIIISLIDKKNQVRSYPQNQSSKINSGLQNIISLRWIFFFLPHIWFFWAEYFPPVSISISGAGLGGEGRKGDSWKLIVRETIFRAFGGAWMFVF